MAKIVIIGAGSGFGIRLSADILAYPELREGTIALVDINREKLDKVTRYVEHIVQDHGLPTKIVGAENRREVLEGAEFVVVAISVGGPAYNGVPYYWEIEIPKRYGVSQQVGDTVGPGGVFRALRTGPEMLAICRDMEELCPDALMLNYTNPMAMLTWLMSEATKVNVVGLCHSVQGTARRLAEYIGADPASVSHWVAGINHMAWFLEFRVDGQDAYPRLWQAMEDPEIYAKDPVRFEIMRHFDYFVTESTRHMSEYVPYFRKRPELLEHFGLQHREPEKHGGSKRWEWMDEKLRRQVSGEERIELKQSHEYAAHIIHAKVTGARYRFNGNVRNWGLITNLPEGCCVEVPCLVDETGVHPCHVGELPPQLAALNRANIAVQELAVRAVLEADPRKAFYAVMLDPLTAAVCTPGEVRKMFDELFAAEGELLEYLK